MSKQFNAVLRLRRDNDYNYEKIKDTFIPADGEICLVDTASDGLQAICGNGTSYYKDLQYVQGTLLKGYYYDNNFYESPEHLKKMIASQLKIYLDVLTHQLYFFDGKSFQTIIYSIPTASAESAGIMKLYNTVGQNIDGSMTQKAITDELEKKVEISINEEEETLILDYNII